MRDETPSKQQPGRISEIIPKFFKMALGQVNGPPTASCVGHNKNNNNNNNKTDFGRHQQRARADFGREAARVGAVKSNNAMQSILDKFAATLLSSAPSAPSAAQTTTSTTTTTTTTSNNGAAAAKHASTSTASSLHNNSSCQSSNSTTNSSSSSNSSSASTSSTSSSSFSASSPLRTSAVDQKSGQEAAAAAAAAATKSEEKSSPKRILSLATTQCNQRQVHKPQAPAPPSGGHHVTQEQQEQRRQLEPSGNRSEQRQQAPQAHAAVPSRRVLEDERLRAWLTKFEEGEIARYPEVYFIGATRNKDRLGGQTATTTSTATAKALGNSLAGSKNFGFDDAQGSYVHVAHDHIAYRYEMLKVIGKGSFGSVVQAFDHKQMQYVALKMVRNEPSFHRQAETEISILKHLRKCDTNNSMNVVHMFDHFLFREHTCITFELLSLNLYELTKKNKFLGLALHVVRRFAYSILKCLEALQEHRIIHCDLKPENVLLKQQHRSGIKVIDFGSSCYENQRKHSYIQSRFYRSPETILGASYGLPIDMWSLGCILAELVTGQPLLPGEDEADQLACMMELLGAPPKALLLASCPKRVGKFFSASRGYVPRYCERDMLPNGRVVLLGGRSKRGKVRAPPGTRALKQALANCDQPIFVDFVRACLEWDPKVRMTPSQALRHPWLARRNRDQLATTVGGAFEPQQQPAKGAVIPSSRAPKASAVTATARADGNTLASNLAQKHSLAPSGAKQPQPQPQQQQQQARLLRQQVLCS